MNFQELMKQARSYSTELDRRDEEERAAAQGRIAAAQRMETVRAMPNRRLEIDERSLGKPRENDYSQRLKHPFGTMQQTMADARRRMDAQPEKSLMEQATGDFDRYKQGFDAYNRDYDRDMGSFNENVAQVTMLRNMGVNDQAAEQALKDSRNTINETQNRWGTLMRQTLDDLGAETEGKFREMVEEGEGSTRYRELYREMFEKFGAELTQDLTEYVRQQRNAETMAQKKQEAAAYGREHGVKASVASVPKKVLGGVVGTLDTFRQGADRLFSGSNAPVDWNAPAQTMGREASAIRGSVSQKLDEQTGNGVASFLYNTGMSMLDSAAVLPMGGWGSVVLGTAAANDAMQEAKANGATDDQAIALGTISGVAEVLTEKVSIDSLFSLEEAKTARQVVGNIIKQAIPEASEEAISSVINLFADKIILGEKSRYEQLVQEQIEQNGLNRDQAAARAFLTLAGDVGLDALGGAISGGLFATGKAAGQAAGRGVSGRFSGRGTDVEGRNALEGVDNALEGVGMEQTAEESGSQAMTREQTDSAMLAALEQLQQENEKDGTEPIAPEAYRQTAKRILDENIFESPVYGVALEETGLTRGEIRQALRNVARGNLAEAWNEDTQTVLRAIRTAEAGNTVVPDVNADNASQPMSREQLDTVMLNTLEQLKGQKVQEDAPMTREQTDAAMMAALKQLREGDTGNGKQEEILGQSGQPGRENAGDFAGDAGRNPKQQKAREALRRREEASQIRDRVKAAGGQLTSLYELGASKGSTIPGMMVVPETADTTDVAEARTIAKNEGFEFVPVVGQMEVVLPNAGGRTISVNAMIENGKIIARADSIQQGIIEGVLHEAYHGRAEMDPGLTAQMREKIRNTYNASEVEALADRYMKLYETTFEGMTTEQMEEAVWNEMLADAYAGFQRFADTFGTQDWSDTVQREVSQRPRKQENSGVEYTRFSMETEEKEENGALPEEVELKRMQGPNQVPGKVVETEKGDGNLFREPGMTDAEYEKLNEKWQTRKEGGENKEDQEKADDRIIPKKAFSSTPAMDKLGIKIDGSVTAYRDTKLLRDYDKAAKYSERMLRRRIRDLKATEQERYLAKGLVKGAITADMLNADTVDMNVVTELADYLMAVESFQDDRIAQRRAEIKYANRRVAEELFQDSDDYKPQLKGKLAGLTKLVMNERTPERVVKQIFGEKQGTKIYETYFRPVWVNGAEMNRFESRMLERVKEFQDQNGKTRKLTEKEREFAQRIMEGQAVLDNLKKLDKDTRQRVEAVAQNVNNGQAFVDAVREMGLQKDYHKGLAKAYADYMDTVALSKDMDHTILQNAIKTYQEIYNEMYDAMNDFLVSHGYEEMGFIKGYAPHFQKQEVQQGLFGALKALGVEKESVSELPAEIAGRTADFKPNMKWNPHMKSRKGSQTSYDIQMGFEQYLHYAAEMFYHTDDVMRIREAVNWFRDQYAGEAVSQAIQDAQEDRYKDTQWKREFLTGKGKIKPMEELSDASVEKAYQEYVDKLYEEAKPESLRKYSEFVTWLDNYANIVAGKQSMADRGIEYGGGRNALNAGSRLMRQFAKANVAGNISTVLNQSAQIPLIQQQLGKHMELAAKDMVLGRLKKDDFANRSDFLTDKRGVEKLTTTNMEKFIASLYKPAELMDRMVSTLAVRGRYLQALNQGMDPERAMKEADDFGRRVMGSRMKGAKPLGFESKSFINQMLHVFQVEASNTMDYMMTDMPQAVREVGQTKGKAAAARYVAAAASGYLINAFVLNQVTGALYGGSPAPFDLFGWAVNFLASGWGQSDMEFLKTVIEKGLGKLFGKEDEEEEEDKEFKTEEALAGLGYNIANDIPYFRNVAGVMGWGDQSLPTVGINEMAGNLKTATSTAWDQAMKGQEETGMNWAEAGKKIRDNLLEAGSQVLPGGRQIKKTAQGIEAIRSGGKTSGYGENERLQYPVEDNAWNAARAALFGLSPLEETQSFYASGDKALSAGQTQKVRKLEQMGIDQKMTYDLYQQFREIGEDLTGADASSEKRNAINNLDLTDEQKLQVFATLMMDEDEENYENNLEKYRAMLDTGLSWDDATQAHNTYAYLYEDKELSETEKARELERWIDQQNWTKEQADAVKERFRFWNRTPAEAASGEDKYEYLSERIGSGVPAETVLAALTDKQQENYSTYIQPAGVPADVYLDVLGFEAGTESDKDKNGDTIAGSKKQKVVDYIKGLDLSKKQKRALFLCFYSEKDTTFK